MVIDRSGQINIINRVTQGYSTLSDFQEVIIIDISLAIDIINQKLKYQYHIPLTERYSFSLSINFIEISARRFSQSEYSSNHEQCNELRFLDQFCS